MSDAFEITHKGAVAHLRFTRGGKSNAMGRAFWSDFMPAIVDLDRAGETRALVISGEGANFCSGMDVSLFAGAAPQTVTAEDREAFIHVVRNMQAALSILEDARFPVIAAIQGACIGAGFDLATACDLRYAARNARFRIEETNIGMMADLGVLQRLPRLVPEGIAREMASLGKTLSAERAEGFGLVNEMAEDAEGALALALDAAERISARAPLAVAASKSAITYARSHSTRDGLEHACLMQAAFWNPSDIMTAFAARTQGKAPDFGSLRPISRFPEQGPDR